MMLFQLFFLNLRDDLWLQKVCDAPHPLGFRVLRGLLFLVCVMSSDYSLCGNTCSIHVHKLNKNVIAFCRSISNRRLQKYLCNCQTCALSCYIHWVKTVQLPNSSETIRLVAYTMCLSQWVLILAPSLPSIHSLTRVRIPIYVLLHLFAQLILTDYLYQLSRMNGLPGRKGLRVILTNAPHEYIVLSIKLFSNADQGILVILFMSSIYGCLYLK